MSFKDIVQSHTVELGDLLRQLEGYPPETRVYFGGLDFYRINKQGENLIQIEFNQSVYRTTEDLLVVEDHSK